MDREYIVVNVFSNHQKKEIEHIVFMDEIKFIAWAPGGKAIISLGKGLFINTEESYDKILGMLNIKRKAKEDPTGIGNVVPMQRPEA